jgi:hypothetical protein
MSRTKQVTKTFVISGRTHGMTIEATTPIHATALWCEKYPDEEIDLMQVQTAEGLEIVNDK